MRIPAHMQTAESLAALGIDTSTLRARQHARQQMEFANSGPTRSNTNDVDDPNPWRRITDQWDRTNYHPTCPSDRRRCERIRAQADARDREIEMARQADLEQLRREESPAHARAKEIYASRISNAPANTPEQAASYAEALGHLKRGDYSEMMNALDRVTEDQRPGVAAALEDARRRAADAKVNLAAAELQAANLDAASIEVPAHMLQHPMENNQPRG